MGSLIQVKGSLIVLSPHSWGRKGYNRGRVGVMLLLGELVQAQAPWSQGSPLAWEPRRLPSHNPDPWS